MRHGYNGILYYVSTYMVEYSVRCKRVGNVHNCSSYVCCFFFPILFCIYRKEDLVLSLFPSFFYSLYIRSVIYVELT
jgi:hypothetical protein